MRKGVIEVYIKNEEFRYIKNTDNLYMISENGNIFSCRSNQLLSRTRRKDGYEKVALIVNGKKSTYLVHRLVADTFIQNTHNKKLVNHIDGIKHNNCVHNLEWVDYSENITHAYKMNLRRSTFEKYSDDFIDELCKSYILNGKKATIDMVCQNSEYTKRNIQLLINDLINKKSRKIITDKYF